MTYEALGIIETRGYIGIIEAADAMTKAANVTLTGYMNVGAGLVSTTVRGDVGAVNAAITAGVAAAEKVGTVEAYHVIPRPHPDTEQILLLQYD